MEKKVIFADNILIPNTEDFTSWACIACDQFTSEPEYWDSLQTAHIPQIQLYLN